MEVDGLLERMQRDWDGWAREDAKYYIACQQRNQCDAAFDQGAGDVIARIQRDYAYLPMSLTPDGERVFLEIGCGIGRLMRVLAQDCSLIHGVDISEEMVRRGRERLADLHNVRFHVASNSDLAGISRGSVHLIYSYAVFQHIPHCEFVHRYLDEAFRVLKPGGIFTGHFKGAPTVVDRCDTWVGVWLTEGNLLGPCRQKGWQVLSSEGAGSQYMWVTLRKPLHEWREVKDGPLPKIAILAVEGPGGGKPLIAGGPQGFASIYLSGLPEYVCDLMSLSVTIGETLSPIRYIGPMLPNHGRQINVQILEETPAGEHSLILRWRGQAISNPFEVRVQKMEPRHPRLVAITDFEEILVGNVIRCGRMQILIDGLTDIASMRTTVGGRLLVPFEVFRVDPLSGLFQANYSLTKDLRGEFLVRVEADGELLPSYAIQVQVSSFTTSQNRG